jgi:DNA-binding transcriptional LysR family regulator
MSKFDWNDLQAFLALVRAGRLTVAAQRMCVDHSTLSRRIVALETAMGVPLFERRKEGFILTSEGARLVEDAETIEALTRRMRSRLEDQSAGLVGKSGLARPKGLALFSWRRVSPGSERPIRDWISNLLPTPVISAFPSERPILPSACPRLRMGVFMRASWRITR